MAEAVRGVTDRVVALEEYAEQVKAADTAYHAASLAGHVSTEVENLTEQVRAALRALEDSSHRLPELHDE
jgi:GTP1/Obg family GTP-binding protein